MSSEPALKVRPVLYDDEASPECRKVRLALTTLDLDVEIRPCPPGGARFRLEMEAAGGAAPPVLVDENHGTTLTDASEIVAHLRRYYEPSSLSLGVPDPAPSAIELYGYETCFYCARVRAALSQLELPYTLRSMGPGSAKRAAFRARHGTTGVPFLEDASTGVALFESKDIVRYLVDRYGDR
jgi:glutathione S-transferase